MKLKLFLFTALLLIMSCSSSGDDSPQVIQDDDSSMMEEEMEDDMMMEEEEEVDLYEGDFVSAAHPTSGQAIVNEDHTLLSFTDFKTDDGPILEVYLATDTNASEYISLGELQGIEGDFEYNLPEGVNFETHNYVLIWCVDFSVNFGHAILE
ncbi:MAG TPA: DM13 domain-containing protein [Flavobacteriaceae bacterium]|nr:DM13 domain-containing protein [Flavobacteriaceae bacterium]